jgi:hypothetical protein
MRCRIVLVGNYREGNLNVLHRVISAAVMGDASSSEIQNKRKGSGKSGRSKWIRHPER